MELETGRWCGHYDPVLAEFARAFGICMAALQRSRTRDESLEVMEGALELVDVFRASLAPKSAAVRDTAHEVFLRFDDRARSKVRAQEATRVMHRRKGVTARPSPAAIGS